MTCNRGGFSFLPELSRLLSFLLGSLFVAGKAANDIESYRHTQGGRSNGTETIYGDTRREMVRGVVLRLRPLEARIYQSVR